MSCSHCESAVTKALEALDGVASAEASHEAGTATVVLSADVPAEALKAAVEAEGYAVTDIR
ncbi:MAG: heavy-metal-associated domain-containing protein [Oscillospiraceae bacterium]|nr:heavy-metal-associated domain-containing protein [Oscillospiraceae bacterium]